jgi:hypothetical protein
MQLMCSIGWVPRCSPQNQCVIRGLPQLCTATDCIMRPWDADMMRETAHAFGVDAQTGIEHYNDIAIDVLHNPYYAGFLGDLVKQIIYQTHIIQIITALAGTNDIEMVLQTYLDMDIASKMLFNTVVNEPGYPQHLEGIRVEILRMLNRGDQATLNEVARVLAEKETNNPFFAYLDEGPSSAVRDLTVDLCPTTPEDIGDRSEWAWERTDAEKAWEKSMLWDCIFMSNFYE